MFKLKNSLVLLFVLFFQIVQSQSVLGIWKTYDDETGKEKSIVEIYEENGKIYGKIIELLEKENKGKKCIKCNGTDKDKPILGMVIIRGLSKDGDEYNDGKILDPKSGKIYKCSLSLESKDKLTVRGYVGISLLGRTQKWIRIKK
ncbi:DUF2147 domain-containing protein [Flavobacterium sp.]|uniref:DUF2147 domain-containing protein n=1 Tax=Flavobacterium sp. TaxID=239 RepID=UPI002635DE3F|nr:DUF2147 domain-containing protein [Flavobacterium sp.]